MAPAEQFGKANVLETDPGLTLSPEMGDLNDGSLEKAAASDQHQAISNTVPALVSLQRRRSTLGIPRRSSNATPFPVRYGRSDDYEQKYDEDAYGEEAFPDARIWKVYGDEAELFDLEKIEAWRDVLDVLLVFIGLFSAIVTTFVVQTSQALQPDYTQISAIATYEVLRAIANNSSPNSGLISVNIGDPRDAQATPSTRDIWVNALWFTSLAISLSAALITILVKQWLYHYTKFTSGTSVERARIRQFRFDGLKRYKVAFIIDVLPVLLHVALALFMVGLALFILPLHIVVFRVVVGITGASYALYIISIVIPLLDPQCPYQTPMAAYIHFGFRLLINVAIWIWKLYTRVDCLPDDQEEHDRSWYLRLVPPSLEDEERKKVVERADQIDINSIAWLYRASTNPTAKSIVLEALGGLPPSSEEHKSLYRIVKADLHTALGRCSQLQAGWHPMPVLGMEHKHDRLLRGLCFGGRNEAPKIFRDVYHFVSSERTGARERFCHGVFPYLTAPQAPGVMSGFPLSDLFLRTVDPSSTAAEKSLVDRLALPIWATLLRIAHKYLPGDRTISNAILDAGSLFAPGPTTYVTEQGALTLTAALCHPYVRSLALTYLGAQELDHADHETALSAFQDRLSRLLQSPVSDPESPESLDEVYLLWKILSLRLAHWKEVNNRDRPQRYIALLQAIMEHFLTSLHVTKASWETILHVTEVLSLHTEKTLRAIASPTILRHLLQQYHVRGIASAAGEGAHMAMTFDRKHIGRILDFCVSGGSPELREAVYTTLVEVNMFPEDVPLGSGLDLFWSSSTCGIILEGTRKVKTQEAWLDDWFVYMHRPRRLLRLCKLCMEHRLWSKQLEYISSIAPNNTAWIVCWKELLLLLGDSDYLCSIVKENETISVPRHRLSQGLVQLRTHLIDHNWTLLTQLDDVPQLDDIVDPEPANEDLTAPYPVEGSPPRDATITDPHSGQPNDESAPPSLRSPSPRSPRRAANDMFATVLKAKVVFNRLRRRSARDHRLSTDVDLERGDGVPIAGQSLSEPEKDAE